jgi:hypothetical protein
MFPLASGEPKGPERDTNSGQVPQGKPTGECRMSYGSLKTEEKTER